MERDRRKLGDWRNGVLDLGLDASSATDPAYAKESTCLCDLPLASRFVLISSQSFKLVWAVMKTLSDALMAAPLYSSPVCTREAYFGGGGAFFRTTGGERVMKYWWSVLYSFALIV